MQSRLALAVALSAVSLYAASSKSFVDCNQTELVQAAPELSALAFDPDQSKLDPILRDTGRQLKTMFAKLVDVSIAEEVHEMRFERAPLIWAEQREKFRYVGQTVPFAELRKQPKGGQAAVPNPQSAFLVSGRFLEMLKDLLPENQKQSRFRYLGRIAQGGAQTAVIAFRQSDDSRQGIVWVNEATNSIVRFRTDILKFAQGEPLDSFTRDVHYVPVNFAALGTTPWLPSSAAVAVHFAAGEVYSIHRFSDYHVAGFENDTDPAQLKEDAGEPAAVPGMDEDSIEILLQGVAALQAQKPSEAVAPLRAAATRLPNRFEPGYYLGLALRGTHDLTGAEAQFRDSLKRSPDFAPAHNELGAVLFERGNAAGAVAEFQEALRLAPGDANVRANLDAATKRLPDAKAAPETAHVPPPTGDVTIKVDVRQVLVPVVVTDKDGHHITGLTQADFKVFEDGVEQKISAFASERADAKPPANPTPESTQPESGASSAPPKPLAKRHAYVICVDTMHASFGNFVHVREALQKLFREEESGDSQYVVVGLGRSMEIVQNTTSDPAKVLEALGSSGFRKTFLQSQTSSSQFEMERFERNLQEVRALCDAKDPTCPMRKQMLPSEADRLAESTRLSTIQFLAQFRSIVSQFAAGRGRRTLVLISDGFLMAPGKAAYSLLEAYFPDLRSLRGLERMQDAIEPIFQLAVKGNVPIYTIDSRGLYTSPGLDASRGGSSASAAPDVDRALNDVATEQGMTLSEIAAATGGTAFHNSNDIFAGLKRAFADGREYYMLAYVPSNEAQDGKFRKIAVQVRDKKASVSAKRGYWATPAESRP